LRAAGQLQRPIAFVIIAILKGNLSIRNDRYKALQEFGLHLGLAA
jgi:hypothetical protein